MPRQTSFFVHIRISNPGQRLNQTLSTLFNKCFLHQSDPHLLPGVSHVMDLCCDVAIPGIPPTERTNRTPQNPSRTAKKATFLRQVVTKMTALLLYCSHRTAGNMQRSGLNTTVDVCMRVHACACVCSAVGHENVSSPAIQVRFFFSVRQRAEMTPNTL